MPNLFSLAHHYIIPFVLILSVIVFVHEFGHYWVARRCGIRVMSFSIGFGRPIFKWKDKHGTQWQIAWLPLGGYVKMFGDADPSSAKPEEGAEAMSEAEKKVAFFHQNVNKRMAVVVAGPAANYIFAVILLAALFVFQGQPFSPPFIGSVQDNGVAAHAGILEGDKIVSIDGQTVTHFEDIKRIIALGSGETMHFVVERNGADQTFTLTPEMTTQTDHFGGTHQMGKIGVVSGPIEYKKWPPLKALKQSVVETYELSAGTLKAIGQMITGTRASDEIGGPLRIAEMSGKVSDEGGWAIVWFMAIISINLGLVNLFPVPLLDGGHLVFYAFERVFGRPMNEKVQEFGMRTGMVLVLSLMVFATWNDLVHLEVISKIRALFS